MQSKQAIMSFQLDKIQQNVVLLQYSKTVSNNCYNFTIDLLKYLQQLKAGQHVGFPKYEDLFKKNFKYKKIVTPSILCAKVLTVKSVAFKCFQCQNQDNSIICIQCFNKSNHKGHSYQKIPVNGGCCDCGDDQKWKNQGSCTDHNKKDIEIVIDKQQNQKFSKQMKYILYIAFVQSLFILVPNQKIQFEKYLQAFLNFLVKFNEQSMISNQMTALLFFSPFNKAPQVHHHQKYYSLKITVFEYLLRFYKMKQFSRILVDLFIMLFTRPWFKKQLTYQYNVLINKKPIVLGSQASNISCQIYTSNKIISELLSENRFPPIAIGSLQNQKFQTIADLYSRFYLDIVYLANLYNNVGQIYMRQHFTKSDICQLSGYQNYVRDNIQQCTQYYGIQAIYFIRCVDIFSFFKKDHKTLLVSIINVVNHIKNQSYQTIMSYYISKQRTLILLLIILGQGNIQKIAMDKQFLQNIGINGEVLYKILQTVLYLLRFYAVNLANRQTVQRYYTFYAFSLYKKPRFLVSLDFQIIRFCMLALQNFKLAQQFYFQQQLYPTYQGAVGILQYQLPVDKLIALPVKFIKNINKNVIENDEGAYDRRKALGVLIDYIGLLHQLIISNASNLCIQNTYKLDKKQQQLFQFYGTLLKSLQSIKIDQFNQICKLFVNEIPNLFQKFVKENCIIQNKKICLKNQKINQFSSVNLSYFKSLKGCELLNSFLQQNQKQNGYHKTIINYRKQAQNKILENKIFNTYFMNAILTITQNYITIFKQHPSIVDIDLAQFQKFIQQLIKLYYTLQSEHLKNLFTKVKNCSIIFKKFAPKVISEILKILQQKEEHQNMIIENNNNKQSQTLKKQQMQQAKNKKLQKFKQKQAKAINNIKQKQNLQMKDEKQQHLRQQCMFCKLSNQQQPLAILCFTQKSSFFSTMYLGCNRNIIFITSCNHFAHQSCNLTVNQNRKYIYCNFCKASSNYLLTINQVTKQKINQFNLNQDDNDNDNDDQLYDQPSNKININKNINNNYKKNKLFSQIFFSEEEEYIKQKLSTEQSQIQTIATQIIFGAIIDYQFFVKSLAKVCCFLFRQLALKKITINRLMEQLEYDMKKSELNQQRQMFWNIYKFTILSIASLLVIKRQNNTGQWDIRHLQEKIPQEVSKNITMLLSLIKSVQTLKILQQQKLIPFRLPVFTKMPIQLQQLSSLIGACPSCSRITNQICICMLCPFKSCVGCQCQNLTQHVDNMHGQSSIFIRVDEGWPLYVSSIKNKYFNPLYTNFMGEYFTIFKDSSKSKFEYKLDISSYQKIKIDLIRHRIQQQIRYQELKTGKVSQLNP